MHLSVWASGQPKLTPPPLGGRLSGGYKILSEMGPEKAMQMQNLARPFELETDPRNNIEQFDSPPPAASRHWAKPYGAPSYLLAINSTKRVGVHFALGILIAAFNAAAGTTSRGAGQLNGHSSREAMCPISGSNSAQMGVGSFTLPIRTPTAPTSYSAFPAPVARRLSSAVRSSLAAVCPRAFATVLMEVVLSIKRTKNRWRV